VDLLVLILVTVIGFALMIRKPVIGLCLVVFVNFGFPIEFGGVFGRLGTSVRLLGILLALAYLVRISFSNEKVKIASFTTIPFLIFLIWRLFEISRTRATEAAHLLKDPGSASEFALRLVMYVVLYILIINVCRNIKDINAVVVSIIGAVFLSALYSFLIYFNPSAAIGDTEKIIQETGRIAGLRGNPGETASITAIGIGLLLPLMVYRKGLRKCADGLIAWILSHRLTVMILFVAFVSTLILAGARAGILAVVAVVLIQGFRNLTLFLRLVLPITLVVSVLMYWAPPSEHIVEHLQQIPIVHKWISGHSALDVDSSAAGRFDRSLIAVDIAKSRPFIGAGYGNYELEMESRIWYGSNAHNLYAEILGEEGTIGLLIYVILISSIAFRYLVAEKTFNRLGLFWHRVITLGLFLAFIAFCADRVFGNGDEMNTLVFLFLGLADALGEISVREARATNPIEVEPKAVAPTNSSLISPDTF